MSWDASIQARSESVLIVDGDGNATIATTHQPRPTTDDGRLQWMRWVEHPVPVPKYRAARKQSWQIERKKVRFTGSERIETLCPHDGESVDRYSQPPKCSECQFMVRPSSVHGEFKLCHPTGRMGLSPDRRTHDPRWIAFLQEVAPILKEAEDLPTRPIVESPIDERQRAFVALHGEVIRV